MQTELNTESTSLNNSKNLHDQIQIQQSLLKVCAIRGHNQDKFFERIRYQLVRTIENTRINN